MYVQYESVIHDVDTFVPKGSQGVFSKGNEVIIPASGETAEDISRASFVDKSGVLLGGDLNILTPDGGIDPAFLAMEISSGKVKRDLSSKAQGKTIVHIHKDDIASLEAGFPSLDEQRKISSVFLGIDSLLSLHQRSWTTDPCSNKPGQRSHDQIDVFVLELLDDVEVGSLGCVHG